MKSVCGDSSFNKDTKIAQLEEKIRQMEAANKAQPVHPSWITRETEAVEQCLDEFRVAFNEAKQFILEKRNNEDIAEDYEELKKASQHTDEVKQVWMSAARDVKKHLNGITQKLNRCCGNSAVDKPHTVMTVEEQLWMNLDRYEIPANQVPTVVPTDVVPAIDAEAIKICKGLVGSWKFDTTNRPCPDIYFVPSKLMISFIIVSGFFSFKTESYVGWFRPDGKRYNIRKNKLWDRQCTIIDNQIVCRFISCSDVRIQEHSFRFVSEGRIEYTLRHSVAGPTEGPYAYIVEI